MPADKFSATWVSHSSICDFLKCPRAYYLKNVYKSPETGHKMSVMSPPLALGGAVHEVVEALSVLPTQDRFRESLITKFDKVWQKVSGKRGGFFSEEQEAKYKKRGEDMLRRVMEHPGPLKNLAVKIKMDLPHYWLSEEDGIILCGKIDWLEYSPDTDTVQIIDFKTGKNEEDSDSLQLPIYTLLVANCQKRKATKACYWYLDRSNELSERELPDLEESRQRVLKIAKEIKLARKLEIFKCPQQTGCYACKPFEAVLRGEAEFVGTNEYNADVYVFPESLEGGEPESVIL
jgi:CRISPR/Cas system-associated exonuclease Cas4 (RecB family)